jgi:DNA-binding NtrC family response regulator
MLRAGVHANDFLVAESSAMRTALADAARYADGVTPVLICGEHGSGRELVARVLHHFGPRRGARFVSVRPSFENADDAARPDDDECARMHQSLRSARGGTLVVKDVSDLSAASQRTLRAAIRDKATDAQVVATGDLDLDRAVEAKIISRNLHELFAGHRILVPPLRERLEDLPELFDRWVRHYGHEIGHSAQTVSARVHKRLASYPWPGNVAELKAIARRLVVRVSRARIEVGDVDEVLPAIAARVPLEDIAFEDMVAGQLTTLVARIGGYPAGDLYEKVMAYVERPLFQLVLAHTGGNRLKAAKLLGIHRNTLGYKLNGRPENPGGGPTGSSNEVGSRGGLPRRVKLRRG